MRKVLALLIAVCACGAAPKPYAFTTTVQAANPLVGKAWDSQANHMMGVLVSPDRAETAALDVPFVLLGEKHDNPDHHRLQARTLRAIVDHGRHPVVAFEQIDLDLQPAVDAWLARGSSNVDGLRAVLEWDKRGWPPWSMYRPIFEVVVSARLKIVATGLSRDVVRKVVHEGPSALPPEIAPRVRLVPLEPALAKSLDEEIEASHCGMLPQAMIEPMALTQRIKDALMANLMVTNAGKDGAVLIAGNGHTRSDRGVPLYVNGRTMTISFVEVSQSTDPATYAADEPARFLVFTPRVDDEDPCAQFHH